MMWPGNFRTGLYTRHRELLSSMHASALARWPIRGTEQRLSRRPRDARTVSRSMMAALGRLFYTPNIGGAPDQKMSPTLRSESAIRLSHERENRATDRRLVRAFSQPARREHAAIH